jgi:hypothetical protein
MPAGVMSTGTLVEIVGAPVAWHESPRPASAKAMIVAAAESRLLRHWFVKSMLILAPYEDCPGVLPHGVQNWPRTILADFLYGGKPFVLAL